jgi:hypothetical protein
MFDFDFFRSFLPMQNPLGFGAGDALLLVLALLLVFSAILWGRWLEPRAGRFASKTGWCMLGLALLPLILRLVLLPNHPVPKPDVYDEFSHLLAADTLRHFRLANPPHALSQFFETQFVLQQPTYSSIYPIGQGLVMAVGWLVFGHPWAGVLLAVSALSAMTYWMLRAWTTPGWALLGGVLAAIEFGPLSSWMNSYWGGAAAAAAGCLVFGALPRFAADGRTRDAVLLGLGLGLHFLIRPYESIFLLLAVLLFVPRIGLGKLLRLTPATAAVLPAILLFFLHNHAVTGSWTTMPYQLSQYQYGVPSALTFQSEPAPQRPLNREQELNYKMQLSFRGLGFLGRLEYRIRYYRFFFLPPLYLAAAAFLWSMREYRFLWVGVTLALFAIGTNFFPIFEPHYLAVVTCLFVLVSVIGLQNLARISSEGARLLVFLSVAQFVFWYTMHWFDGQPFSQAVRRYETWSGLNHANPAMRIAVDHQLAQLPGKLLVLVRYYPQHIFQEEWVYNAADIDASRIVWARDLGDEEDRKLRAYYPDRSVWLLEPDFRPPRLQPYAETPPAPKKQANPFEEVK